MTTNPLGIVLNETISWFSFQVTRPLIPFRILDDHIINFTNHLQMHQTSTPQELSTLHTPVLPPHIANLYSKRKIGVKKYGSIAYLQARSSIDS
ncbi:hypothetical protein NPIL_560081 [Nephila pilipes]|uniref:Uncharacterized protein n=1 Tax=Nephila pilipes TaxID=299642 RepID=A0A8X6PQQ5_NEPPI|nr:hypothetical protein NPIL_560081 [Nephila pilipes]